MRKIKIIIAYDGTNYHGWQIQKNANTIEAEITKACHKIFSGEIKVLGASRTDAGVHALGQVATIEVDTAMETWRVPYALNAHLPKDIVVQSAEEVDLVFHPQYYALEKTYSYKIYNTKIPLPQYNRFTHFYYKPLKVDRMKEAAKYFIGEHDFKAFCTKGGSAKTTVRTIYECKVTNDGYMIEIIVRGNGFLYNMVRIMVGALIQVGLESIEPYDIKDIIESKIRQRAGKMAPELGLTLVKIKY